MSVRETRGFLPVASALTGNILVAGIKFFAASVSGSSALLSEAIHSVADTLNQALLLVGLNRSLKKPDEAFEYGYGNERFFFALISACGIFFLGAGVTLWEGIGSLLHPAEVAFSGVIFWVLLASFVVESYTFYIAARDLKKAFPELSWKERLNKADSSTLAVLLEDAVAVLGVFAASAAIALSYTTGNSGFDAAGSIVVGILLAGVAMTLIVRNRTHLLGHAMPEESRKKIIAFLEAEPSIEKVIDFKSSEIALGVYRIKCEVEFNGSALLREAYRASSMQEAFEEVKDDVEEFKKFSVDYADRIPRLIGRAIDDIEKRLRGEFPEVRHIDIEIN